MRRKRLMLLFAWVVLAASLADRAQARASRRAAVDEQSLATLEEANRIFLEVQARKGDSYVSLATRYGGTERVWAWIEAANAGRQVTPGLFYAIPFEALSEPWRARALLALFPGDGPGEDGWVHRVPEGDEGQTLESLALWFASDPRLADDLAESNGVDWAPLPAGTEIFVPSSILSPGFQKSVPALVAPAVPEEPKPVPPPPPPARGRVTVGELTFVDDETGSYAIYRLKRGEALYSSVVARFTGRLDPDEVSRLADVVAKESGIREVTSIRIGHPVRIPRDLILPEYLPPGDPQRAAYDKGLAEAQRHKLTVRARDLEGITIILDAGHGGDDVGARRNGVHEDDYVYDILCRIKRLAEETTGARVLSTIRDRSSAYRPLEGPFGVDRDEYLLTTPEYHPRQPHVGTAGVNLRWYLVNSHFRDLVEAGTDPQRIVFVSIHADSLHPSVRGAMVYVPGQAYRTRTYGHVGRLYERQEVRELRYVSFSRGEKARSEGLSRRLAAGLMEAFAAAGLPVHQDGPIRDHVIRGRRTYTPAVIRASLVPQSLLLEVVNLSNRQDAALIKDPGFRQRVAVAFLDALRTHYAGARSAARPVDRAAQPR